MSTFIENPSIDQVEMAISILTRNYCGAKELLPCLRLMYQSLAEDSISLGDRSAATPEETGLNLLVLRIISTTIEEAR